MRGVQVSGDRRPRRLRPALHRCSPRLRRRVQALLNSFLPRKRAISQMRDPRHRRPGAAVRLTYKSDRDLPGGVVEVGESHPPGGRSRGHRGARAHDRARSPAAHRLAPPVGRLGRRPVPGLRRRRPRSVSISPTIVQQTREIAGASFCDLDEIRAHCADYTARRIESALRNLDSPGPTYVGSRGRRWPERAASRSRLRRAPAQRPAVRRRSAHRRKPATR